MIADQVQNDAVETLKADEYLGAPWGFLNVLSMVVCIDGKAVRIRHSSTFSI